MADGRAETEKLFGDVGSTLSAIGHHYEFFNHAFAGDVVVVEGTSHGATAGGVTHSGRFCDVFEIRNGKIRASLSTSTRATLAPTRRGTPGSTPG